MGQAATIHLAQWRNDSNSLKLFLNNLERHHFYTSGRQFQRQFRVSVTFPALIFARLHLCRRFGYSGLSHALLRFRDPCRDILNKICRSQKIPGLGCREKTLAPKDVIVARQLVISSLLCDLASNFN
jgi:hypothetical protein